ncbi:SURF1 family cytochrome oxidase biogenesis protein [Actinocatenispora rupis]|uniref:SURF1-like protein n=1 Tax=Actinocatenispora rupis TaxID=519421 RepID=A0A8J3N9J1_9ACTN|nr:SURF1 family protein [Actinocatenispora rupis]GID11359.1 hypothetical protein Aru02nite_22480 [Actinocatenispora rupis]
MPDPGQARPNVLGVLRTPRWLLFGLIAIGLAVTMIFLGIWQLHRYELRSGINARIDAHAKAAPVPAERVLPVGRAPADADEYTRVTVTGRYDAARTMLVRARTVNGNVGYEVVTPLRRADGTAVLVDRGWLPPGGSDTVSEPKVPAAPTGQVTVVGQVRLPESGAGPVAWRNGHVEVRRIDPRKLATALPYPATGGYVTLTHQTPAAAGTFVAIPIDHENAAMNLSYIVQWWLFSGIALVGYGLLIRWESRKRVGLSVPGSPRTPRPQARPRTDRLSDDRLSDDRVPERRAPRSDDRVPEDRVPEDRVSDDRVPEDRVLEDRVPEDRVPENRVSESRRVSDDRVPEDRVPDRVPEDRVPDRP